MYLSGENKFSWISGSELFLIITMPIKKRLNKESSYSSLASVYDRLMSHVEYDEWADLINKISRRYIKKKKISIFEIGGGTGSLAKLLIHSGYNYYGSDLSPHMCREAAQKKIPFFCADCRALPLKKSFDLVIFLYDGINYLPRLDHYSILFDQVYQCLNPGGYFLFDITTETNSIRHFFEYLDFEEYSDYSMVRHSYYDEEKTLQYNDFTIFKLTDEKPDLYEKISERHIQKVLPPKLIEDAVPRNLFKIIGIWDGFSERKYSIRSERIHFLLKKIV